MNARDMASRIQRARAQQIPLTNYGMTIARAHNILPRALAPLAPLDPPAPLPH